jgi:uncharacterized membrane protein YdbT with pleckstrin-like domain
MDHDLLWYDKKRYMGMPISFTRYSLSSDRLFLSTGFLTIRDEEILLYRVKDLNTKRTLWQRLFGVGTITVASSDKSMPLLEITNVKDPVYVKELIHENVEVAKRKHRVRHSEISGDFDPHDDFDDDLD